MKSGIIINQGAILFHKFRLSAEPRI